MLFDEHWRPLDGYLVPIIYIWLWWAVLFTVYRVEIDDRTVRFTRIVGSIKIQANDIKAIEHSLASIKIVHSNGKVRVTSLINNFSGLLASFKALNQSINIKGGK